MDTGYSVISKEYSAGISKANEYQGPVIPSGIWRTSLLQPRSGHCWYIWKGPDRRGETDVDTKQPAPLGAAALGEISPSRLRSSQWLRFAVALLALVMIGVTAFATSIYARHQTMDLVQRMTKNAVECQHREGYAQALLDESRNTAEAQDKLPPQLKPRSPVKPAPKLQL